MKENSYCKNIDIMNVSSFPNYDIVYCDPPWEQKMVKYFQTIMRNQVGVIANNDINDILKQLARLSSTRKPVFVEYSVKGTDRVISIMKKAGHKHNFTNELLQHNGKPYHLIVFNSDIRIRGALKGFNVVTEVMNKTKPKIVFDPFAGIGKTAKTVLNAGSAYIGYEMNKTRYNRLKIVIDENI